MKLSLNELLPFLRMYKSLEADLNFAVSYVDLHPNNFSCFSAHFQKIILCACVEIESICALVTKTNKNEMNKEKNNAYTLFKRIKQVFYNHEELEKYLIGVKYTDIKLRPFEIDDADNKDSEKICFKNDWWQAYNHIKHAKYDSEMDAFQNHSTLQNSLLSLSAFRSILQLLCLNLPEYEKTEISGFWRNPDLLYIIEPRSYERHY